MRRWASNAIIFLGIPAVVLALGVAFYLWQKPKELGEGISETVGTEFADSMMLQIWSGKEPDLEIAPGTEGHIGSSLIKAGTQFHYYAEEDDQTAVAVEVESVGKRLPVAEYDGRPMRDVAPDQLRPVAIQLSGFLVVRPVDEKGNLRGRIPVAIENVGDTPLHRETLWPDTGVATFIFVRPGPYTVRAVGMTGEVTVGTNETVSCTLSPSGLKVDKREPFGLRVR